MKDRQHQADLRDAVSRIGQSDFPLKILAWVVPAGGKSRLPGIVAQRFQNHKIAWFVPRLSLQHQAVTDISADFGIKLRDSGNDHDPSRGCRGFVATHDALMTEPELWRHEIQRSPYIVVVDECHHAKQLRDGTLKPLAFALSNLKPQIWLNMTGTLETNDGAMIWGMHYDTVKRGLELDPGKSADIYIRYSRKTALDEKSICPIEFYHNDGPVHFKKGSAEDVKIRLSEASREDESAAIFTALRTDVAIQLFESGLAHWRARPSGKLIIVADRQQTASAYATRLRAAGVDVALAIDDNATAHDEVKRFRKSKERMAMATCMMAYEGLDVPAASHVICLTHIRSVPWIEQMLARVWRSGKQRCWAFVPDDPRMNRVIQRIHDEQIATLRDPIDGPGGGDHPPSVLAIDGQIDKIRQAFLDGEFTADETESRVIQFVKEFGLDGTEPQVVALIALLKQPPIVSRNGSETPRETELRLRKQIFDECNKIDSLWAEKESRAPTFGTTQKKLIRLTNKSITVMTPQELVNAYTTVQSLRP